MELEFYVHLPREPFLDELLDELRPGTICRLLGVTHMIMICGFLFLICGINDAVASDRGLPTRWTPYLWIPMGLVMVFI